MILLNYFFLMIRTVHFDIYVLKSRIMKTSSEVVVFFSFIYPLKNLSTKNSMISQLEDIVTENEQANILRLLNFCLYWGSYYKYESEQIRLSK